MNYYLPFILSFLLYFNCNILSSSLSFVNKDIRQIFSISKFQLGLIYGLLAFSSVVGIIINTIFTTRVRKYLITTASISLFFYGAIHLIFFVILTMIVQRPHKSIYYLFEILNGISRVTYIPAGVMILKLHKEKARRKLQIDGKQNNVSQNCFKLITIIWAVGYDLGSLFGSTLSNLMEDTLKIDWRCSIVIGSFICMSSAILLYSCLKQYIQQSDQNQELNKLERLSFSSPNNNIQRHSTTFRQFFTLLNEHSPNLLFLINISILDLFHGGVVYTLAPYLHSSGFRGNEGYISALFNLCSILGSWFYGLIDYYVNKFFEMMKKDNKSDLQRISDQQQSISQKRNRVNNSNMKINKKQKVYFHYTSTISLFLFFITSMIIFIDSLMKSQQKSTNTLSTGTQTTSKEYIFEMVLIGLLGLFSAGPTKSYFSHHCINVINDLQNRLNNKYLKIQKNLSSDLKQSQDEADITSQSLSSLFTTKKYQISIFLVNLNNFLWRGGLIIFLILSLFMIDKCINYLFGFYSLLAFSSFVIDLVINYTNNKAESEEIEVKSLVEPVE